MRDAKCRGIVEESLRHFDGAQYFHHAWVIMPNHVHALVSVMKDEVASLAEVIGAWKSVSAHRVNACLGRKGALWQEDYFDRLVRNGQHFANCVRYVRRNPEKARLREGAFTHWESELALEFAPAEADLSPE